jgi:uncharacterized membrane protein YbhN (UPF0104 family)
MKKILLLLLMTVVLSFVGQILFSKFYSLENQNFSDIVALIKHHAVYIVFCNLGILALEVVRLKLIGQTLRLKLSIKDAFGAVALNLLFGWTTPLGILGAPALAFYLHHRGVAVAESITVAFARSFSNIVVSAISTTVVVRFMNDGAITPDLQEKLSYFLLLIGTYLGLLIALAFAPESFTSRWRLVSKSSAQIRQFFTQGKLLFVPILILAFIINFSTVSLIPLAIKSHYTDAMIPIKQTIVFLTYIQLMPIPGASGLAEFGAPMIYSSVPKAELNTVVSAMRAAMIFVQVMVGFIFAAVELRGAISLEALRDFRRKS